MSDRYSFFRIKQVQSAGSTYPQLTILIKNDPVNVVSGNASDIFFLVHVGVECSLLLIEHIQSSSTGTDPDMPRFVFCNACNHIVAQAAAVFFVIFISLEFVTVVPVQARIGPDPDEAFFILKNAIDIVIQQVVFSRDTFKMNGAGLGSCG
jgi:hypothetical protein